MGMIEKRVCRVRLHFIRPASGAIGRCQMWGAKARKLLVAQESSRRFGVKISYSFSLERVRLEESKKRPSLISFIKKRASKTAFQEKPTTNYESPLFVTLIQAACHSYETNSDSTKPIRANFLITLFLLRPTDRLAAAAAFIIAPRPLNIPRRGSSQKEMNESRLSAKDKAMKFSRFLKSD